MAKSTRIELKKDDPIFSEGLQTFVPVSRPLTPSSAKNTTGVLPDQSDSAPSAMEGPTTVAVEAQIQALTARHLGTGKQ